MVARCEAEIPGVVPVGVGNGRPVVAVRVGFVEESPVAVSCGGKEDARRGIGAPAADDAPVHAVHCRPGPVALGAEVIQLLLGRHPPVAAPQRTRRVVSRREDALRRDPPFFRQGRLVLAEGRHVLWTERKVKADARPFVANGIAPPEMESEVLWLRRANVLCSPEGTFGPKLDLFGDGFFRDGSTCKTSPHERHRKPGNNNLYFRSVE